MINLKQVHKEVAKEFPNYALMGDELKDYRLHRLPTNILTLDYRSRGGIMIGQHNKIWGAKGSGKTGLALRLAGIYQALNPNKYVVIVDYEHAFLGMYDTVVKSNLYDLNRIIHIDPLYAEQGINMHKKYLEAKEVGLVIVDSIASMFPFPETDGDAQKDHRGLLARAVNKMFRHTIPVIENAKKNEGRDITTILINQVRAKGLDGVGMGMTCPGGYMQEHIPSFELRMYVDPIAQRDRARTGYKYTILKNRGFSIKLSGQYAIYSEDSEGFKRGEVYDVKDTIVYARRANVIVKDKGKYNLSGESFSNLKDLANKLLADPETLMALKTTTLNTLLTMNSQEIDDQDD